MPDRVLSNADLEQMVDTSNEWILTRTGIRERRIAAQHQATSDLAVKAARVAMRRAKITPEEIDLIILATITPDMPFPSTACLVQEKIGAMHAAAFDIQAACSGFIYSLEIAQQFIMTRTYDTVLVIGAEKLSSIINWADRNTCVLFGDGAGAAILRNRPRAHGLLTACMGADGAGPAFCACPAAAPPSLPPMKPSPRGCTICAWTARRLSRTPSRPCSPPPTRPCAAANWTSRKSSASSPIRPTAAS